MERYYEEYAMGLVDNVDDVTIEKILLDRRGEVILIEGDPGCGKTTLTLQICMQWAKDKLMANDFFILVPLRSHELVTTAASNHIFKLFENLGCPLPGMKEYAQQNNGEGLVLLLDGWDELPTHLQSSSLFSDVVFGKNSMFFRSTIVVTSRPSCSENIAKIVQQRKAHYQILGFSPHNSEMFIKHYFINDSQSADLLITMLKGQEYLRRHFYIPITVAIMCFVYSHSDEDQIPETLSKLYEDFVLLYVCSNVPETCRQDIEEFNTLGDIPKVLKPVFSKLCKIAYDMLRDNKLVFDERMLGIANNDLKCLDLNLAQFDGLGLLHVEYFPTKQATTKRLYSFIHRAVQELLAALYVLDTGSICDVLDEYFYEGSFLMNIFPFLFGLVSKELLMPLAGKLIQIFTKSDRSNIVLNSILYCLFEAHDETLCVEFSQAFSEYTEITLCVDTILECHYACYFIAVCGAQGLRIILFSYVVTSCDLYIEILYKYLQNTSTAISSFNLTFYHGKLSCEGIKQFAKSLCTQHQILSVELHVKCDPGCISVLCDSICRHNILIHELILGDCDYKLIESDLESIGSLLTTCSFLKWLRINGSSSNGVCLHPFCEALCEVKTLQKLSLPQWRLSNTNSKVFGNLICHNCSLKELHINVSTADCLASILNGLSSNTSVAKFRAWPSKISTSDASGQSLEKCLTFNHVLKIVDFTEGSYSGSYPYIPWSSAQVISICAGLCANTTVVTLDISGCYIDTEACKAVCEVLSRNTVLQHLLLNPVHLEKQETLTVINSCTTNATLKLLSLVQWPPRKHVYDQGKDQFQYSCDQEIDHKLQKLQNCRQEKGEPDLKVYWLVAMYFAYVAS